MSNYDVNVKYNVDSSGLGKAQQEVDKVSKALKNATNDAVPLGKGIKDSLSEATKAASGVSAGFAGMASAATAAIAPMTALSVAAAPLTLVALALAAIAAAAGGAFTVITGRLSSISEMADAMDNLGGRTQRLAELFAIMEVSGESFDKIAASLQKFQNNIAKVVESGDDVAAAMGRAGIDMRKLAETAKTDVAGAYTEVITKLAGVTDKNDLALIKQKLLGKSLAETAQIANDAADAQEKLALAYSLGLVQTEEQKQLAQELDGAWDELKAAGAGLATQMVDLFGPSVVTMIKGIANGVVLVAQGMKMVNDWVRTTFGSFDTMLRKFNPIYALAVKLYALAGKAVKANADAALAAAGGGIAADKGGPTTPVNNETDKQREAAAKAAEAAARAAEAAAKKAEAARAKAAAEAQRHLEAYNNLLERSIELQRTIANDNITDGFGYIIKRDMPELIGQFEAAVQAANQVGLVVDGWSVSTDKTSISLTTSVNPALAEAARLAGKTTEQLKKAGDAAVNAAIERAKANKIDEANLGVHEYTAELIKNTELNYGVISEIQNGRIRTEEQLTQYLEDQAFNARVLKEETAGATEEEIRRLKAAREAEKESAKMRKESEKTVEFWENTASSFIDMFIDGLERGKIAWKEWLIDLGKQLAKSYLLKMLQTYLPMLGGASSTGTVNNSNVAAGNFVGPRAMGGAFNNGFEFFANGGVVNRATGFGLAGGKWGVMGEAGPEAIMPLTRGPNGKLGVAAHGGGGTTVVNLGDTTINVQSTSDAARDDRETAQAIDRMLEEKMTRFIAEQRRSGNMLNPNFGFRY